MDKRKMETAADPIRDALQQYFGFRTFLEGQREVIDSVLRRKNTLAIMPTGHGKSLCFQLPAMMLEGVTLVVSPLISLMKDQVDALLQRDIPATYINSSLTRMEQQQRLEAVRAGRFKLLYVAPERFGSETFARQIAACPIALFAVDEAHCISQWGHDFRPDYTRLHRALELLGRPPSIALTATATPEVVRDIVKQLGWEHHEKHITGFDRPNLSFKVHDAQSEQEKYNLLREIIDRYQKGIIYCSTRKNVEKVSLWLAEAGYRIGAYHAGLSDLQRSRIQEQFCSRQIDLIAATNAFGMGIDRADVRFVVHFNIPGNIESYYQEAGRAGRDGEPAICEVLYSQSDVRTQEFFIAAQHPTKRLIHATYSWLVERCQESENGAIEGLSLEEMRERLREEHIDVPSVMTLSSVLTLLRKSAYIESSSERQRKAWWLAREPVPPEELEIDFKTIQRRERLARKKLYQMIELCRTTDCRRYTILAYFDDHHKARGCGICDNCQRHGKPRARTGTSEEQLRLQKLLSCVARLHGRFGREKVLQVLIGSRSKEIIDAHLDELSTYGLLKEFDQAYIYNLLQACIEAGLVEVMQIDASHPVVLLTERGKQAMKRPASQALRWPLQVEAARRPLDPEERAARRARAMASPRSRRDRRQEQLRGVDPQLYQRLAQLRQEIALAGEEPLPLYRVFPNKVLELMAEKQPLTPDELLALKGVGPSKLRLYGEKFLRCIALYQSERS